ncbi:MAG: hypothetical protein QF541_05350, partial [Lentisphaeria bacterium]|nr:hypothetical protein [Lentisphaeria bacterium]
MTTTGQLCPPTPRRATWLLKLAIVLLTFGLGGTAMAQAPAYVPDTAAYFDANPTDGKIDRITLQLTPVPTTFTVAPDDWVVTIGGIAVTVTPSIATDVVTIVTLDVDDVSAVPSDTAPDVTMDYTDNGNVVNDPDPMIGFGLVPADFNAPGSGGGAGPVPIAVVRWAASPGNANHGYMDVLYSTTLGSPGIAGAWGDDAVEVSLLSNEGARNVVRVFLDGSSALTTFTYTDPGGGNEVLDLTGMVAPTISGNAITVAIPNTDYQVIGFDNVVMFEIDPNGAVVTNPKVSLTGHNQGGYSSSDIRWTVFNGAITAQGGGFDGSTTGNTTLDLDPAAPNFVTVRFNSTSTGVKHGDSFIGEVSSLSFDDANGVTQSIPAPAPLTGELEGIESGNVYFMVKATPVPPLNNTSRINPLSDEITILQIDAADSSVGSTDDETLNAVTVRFVDASNGQFDPKIDLLPLADNESSGVLLYDRAGNLINISTIGMDWSDLQVNDEGHTFRQVTLRPLDALELPEHDLPAGDPANTTAEDHSEAEFEIRFRTSAAFNLADSFYVEIPDDGFLFASGNSSDDLGAGWETRDGTVGVKLPSSMFDFYEFDDINNDNRWNASEPIAKDVVPFYDGGDAFTPGGEPNFDRDTSINQETFYDRNVYFNDQDKDTLLTEDSADEVLHNGSFFLAENDVLLNAAEISLVAGDADSVTNQLYYFDADGSGDYSDGDDIVVKRNNAAAGNLQFDGGITTTPSVDDDGDGVADDDLAGDDFVVSDGGDGIQVTDGDLVDRFTADDNVGFDDSGGLHTYSTSGTSGRSDIVLDRDGDGRYSSSIDKTIEDGTVDPEAGDELTDASLVSPDVGVAIDSVTLDAASTTDALFTTAAAHNLAVLDEIRIDGVGSTDYPDGIYTVRAILTSDSFTADTTPGVALLYVDDVDPAPADATTSPAADPLRYTI